MATYERELKTTASPDRLWQLWSDPSTWSEWNPNVTSMTMEGPFAPGSVALMHTPAGRTHRMAIVEVEAPRSFALKTKVVPGTNFVFRCRIEPAGDTASISQSVTIGGPLGPIFGAMAGKRVAADFGPVLRGLAAAAGDTSASTGGAA